MGKINLNKLITTLAKQEGETLAVPFLSPCVVGGRVRVLVGGLIRCFKAPAKYEGWGMFLADSLASNRAQVTGPADIVRIQEYLELFPSLRVRLIRPLQGQTWLAWPVNEGDCRQRLGRVEPLLVHLVTEGARFEQAVVRIDGQTLWFQELDRRADPLDVDFLNQEFSKLTSLENLTRSGLTPEAKTTYSILVTQELEFQAQQVKLELERIRSTVEGRLKHALKVGGGELQTHLDRGDHWVVGWQDSQGNNHSSAISKDNLTVISSGICLSGRDGHFDLESLVGVVEQGNQRGYRDYNDYNDYEDDY